MGPPVGQRTVKVTAGSPGHGLERSELESGPGGLAVISAAAPASPPGLRSVVGSVL